MKAWALSGKMGSLTILCGNRSTSLECPDLGVAALPDSPDAVDHAVVQPEDWVTRAGVLVRHHPTYPKVASGVRALEGLEFEVEGCDVREALDDVDDVGRLGVVGPLGREV